MIARPLDRTRNHVRNSRPFAVALVVASLIALASSAEPVYPGGLGASQPLGADVVVRGLDAAVAPAVGAIVSTQRPLPKAPQLQISEGVLGRGETLARALGRVGVSPALTHEITRSLAPHFDFRRAQPGHHFTVTRDPAGQVVHFEYLTAPNTGWKLDRSGDSFEVTRREARVIPRTARIAGLVQDTLYGSISKLGEDGQLAHDYADVFAWDIDFSRAIRSGDAFEILYERLYRLEPDGRERYVGPGRILAARYDGHAGHHEAVYFESEHGRGGYYHPDGTSVEGQFLMSPVWKSRITSSYSNARRHPILKITRPHQGIDYAAPAGTPVWAVADGVVVHRQRTGGFGNLVKIRHRNGYVTFYSHLSRYAKDLRIGQSVRQKQVIGYVGSTGLATGPHVCFRLTTKNGKYVNPLTVRGLATREPVATALLPRFRAARDMLFAELDGPKLAARDAAKKSAKP